MADNTDNESITEIVPKVLNKHFEDQISGLRQTLEDFPAPNDRIQLPCISTFSPSQEFAPEMQPYPKTKAEAADIVDSKANTLWVVGQWDMSLQIDIFAGNKEELDDMFDQVFNALNPNISPMGVVLPMEEYYDQLCDYLYVSHTRQNTAEQSQRDEWRMTLTVLATCKAIRFRKEFIIEESELDLEVQ